MAFVVSNITNWVNENSQTLIEKAILEANSFKYITIIPGIKYKETVKFLEGDSLIQCQACGTPTSSGTTTLDDKEIEVKKLMVYEELCPKDLENTSLQLSMKPGYPRDIPFAAQYAEMKVKNIQKRLEQLMWLSTSDATLSACDPQGLIITMSGDTDTIWNNTAFDWSWATGWTVTDLMNEVYTMDNSLPAEVYSDTNKRLFCGFEVSRKMIQCFVKAGNYHIDFVADTGNNEWIFPGTNITVTPVNGLNATNYVVLTPGWNIIVGTDLTNEEEKFRLWWSEDDQILKFIAQWKIGFNYYFGEYIVVSHA